MAKKKKDPSQKKAAKAGLPEFDLENMPPIPDRRMMEQLMRELGVNLGGGPQPETPLDRAQELIYEAMEASGAKQVRLARKALEISPDCADAYVLLAENEATPEAAMKFYEQGVAAGQRALGPEAFDEGVGHFWGIVETRPYMRALEGLAQCLWGIGRREEAAAHYQEMLRLNPGDNQGVRYSLATLLLDLARDEEVGRLLAEYDEDSAELSYTRVLLAFRKEGDSPETAKLLKQAVKANKHVPAYLLGVESLPSKMPSYITMGGKDEAVNYIVGSRRVWLNTPGAITWLRKTLDIPLPREPRPRRPAWGERKTILLRLPQERGEVWQVDAMPLSAPGDDLPSEEEAGWAVLIVGRTSRELLGIEPLDGEPKPADVWEYLMDVMTRPREAEPRRPVRIEVRSPAFHKAWKAKLKQIGVDCVLSPTLETLDGLIDELPDLAAAGSSPPAVAATPEELLALPRESDDVWQADARPMPAWITGDGQPYRPWMGIVISHENNLVLAHQLAPDHPPAAWMWDVVAQAMRQPTASSPHRPGVVEVNSAELFDALRPRLEAAGVRCEFRERLEHLDFVLDEMAKHMHGPNEPPSLLDVPGVEPEQVGSFYEAAADYYRKRPWQKVAGDTIIKVECDRFQSGPWYAVVMGQSGVQQGVAIYEDLASLRTMMTGDGTDEDNARGMSGLSLMFSEAFDLSTRDVDAAQRNGWPVAGPEAYPLVLRVNPGMAIRPPLAWELHLLEGCLRTIPAFVSEKAGPAETTVPTASGDLTLRLGWSC